MPFFLLIASVYQTVNDVHDLDVHIRSGHDAANCVCFLCSFDGSTESQIDMVFMKDPHGSYRFLWQMRDDIGGGKGDDDIAAAIAR